MSTYLVGKTLTGLKLASDRKALLFQTTEGDAVVKVDGDCCSNSWIEHIEMPALGLPAQVLAVDSLDLPGTSESEWGDVTAVYGCKITTDKGEIVIDYRNSSNGYYGGNLSWPDDDYFYGGVYGQNVSSEEWQEVPA